MGNPFGRFAPLSLQFERFTSANKSLLPSLSVGGMSCHCINLVETQNTIEVLGMYRFLAHEQSPAALPSSARKCWAKKVRQYLYMKSMLFNISVNDESELLSLLSAADIRAIGGEIF